MRSSRFSKRIVAFRHGQNAYGLNSETQKLSDLQDCKFGTKTMFEEILLDVSPHTHNRYELYRRAESRKASRFRSALVLVVLVLALVLELALAPEPHHHQCPRRVDHGTLVRHHPTSSPE